MLMSQWSWAEKILYPYAVILQTIPILALVPLIGIWMGYSFAGPRGRLRAHRASSR